MEPATGLAALAPPAARVAATDRGPLGQVCGEASQYLVNGLLGDGFEAFPIPGVLQQFVADRPGFEPCSISVVGRGRLIAHRQQFVE